MRKAEKRKAKLGAEPTHDLQEPKGNSRVTQQASHVRDTKDTVGVRALCLFWAVKDLHVFAYMKPDKSTKKQNHIGNGEGNENDSRKSKRRKHSEDPSVSCPDFLGALIVAQTASILAIHKFSSSQLANKCPAQH